MNLTIINIANKMPNWVDEACEEYLKRCNYSKYSCSLISIKASKTSSKSPLDNMLLEAKKIKSKIPDGSFIIALDGYGISLKSVDLAKKLANIAINNANIVFIIGGADGIHPQLKEEADLILSLSLLTFPHALVRVIILEQLYRAISILEKHPYHRE